MMYILTQEEYDNLQKQQRSIRLENKKKLQQLCTKIADTMPIEWGWGPTGPTPWGCILTKDDWYCDQCPIQEICPCPNKTYSQ